MNSDNEAQGDESRVDNQSIVAKVSEATDVVAEAGDLVATVVSTAASDIGSYIRSQREAAQVSLRQLASRAGVSNPYLSQIERGLRKPSAEVLGQIAKGLRVSSEALYVRAGFLEERPHGPVRDALLGDPEITERQKHVLIEIYDSFRRENEQTRTANDVSVDTRASAEPDLQSEPESPIQEFPHD
ncbi:helix-turn-helix domain-containing protein [Rhodococcus sp. BP-252]|uniref:helix-turn-helix domain-containing protein n=1 Tax=Nocardiaceae TaxID=85025 RepID=UPI000A060F5F|nr:MULTISPECIES: helix-turn-helix transcriptional regulator [Rhodococcus]MBY6413688.1 helix-turn-helix domain-containing protein [Rhodococcus sp. BP-320]MBY6418325.1 helix-turn-helix domain-containing protein [Rhodococcus sp. BP-321]MBY6422450.1 helix-turn-helix domain-containing protein [Rhodococcus sp. BP-324]MBY6428270.1 helix-turn-helix domain-containing protein [Rhodococcus sp. BP-323]MBY6433447.1 helix-turn-helix domain-containing protein [Rhodococcus sp. BP-322]